MSMTGDYPNRSDLRNPATRQVRFTGQTYGQATQQAQAQQAVPAGSSPEMVQAQQMAAQQQGAPRPQPGAQPLARPSERPNEPITAGAPFGPGPQPVTGRYPSSHDPRKPCRRTVEGAVPDVPERRTDDAS